MLLLTLRFDLWKAFALLSLFLIRFFPTGLGPPVGTPVGDYYGPLRNDMGKHVPATGSTGSTNFAAGTLSREAGVKVSTVPFNEKRAVASARCGSVGTLGAQPGARTPHIRAAIRQLEEPA